MTKPIVVINPNSTEAVTEAMSAALDPLRLPGGPEIECLTNADGPPGIESQADVDLAAVQTREIVARRANSASAFVIACYSDPGIHACREATDSPVYGLSGWGWSSFQMKASPMGGFSKRANNYGISTGLRQSCWVAPVWRGTARRWKTILAFRLSIRLKRRLAMR